MTSPKYATRRTPELSTAGGRIAMLSAVLGEPLMPWQRLVADVAFERHPDDPTRWRYPTVVITVPRQSGKTTLLRAIAVERMLSGRGREAWLTAQTGKDARARWRDIVKRLPGTPLAEPAVRLRRSAGTEAITSNRAKSLGSFIAPFAPTPKSLHGYSPHLVMVDEAWSFEDDAGYELVNAAIDPAQITLTDRQLVVVSTMGTDRSRWWNALVERGRASVTDPAADLAYFEWSADPNINPRDPEFLNFHPAIGHTQQLDDVLAKGAALWDDDMGTWLRAYGNLYTKTRTPILDPRHLDATATAGLEPPTEWVLSFDAALDRSAGSLWASWTLPDGRPAIAHVQTGPRMDWLPQAIRELHQGPRPPARIVCEDAGPTRATLKALQDAGVPVDALTPRDYATGCDELLGLLESEQLAHDDDEALRAAFDVAALRTIDGTRAFDPVASAGPIDPARAAACALYAAQHLTAGIPIW